MISLDKGYKYTLKGEGEYTYRNSIYTEPLADKKYDNLKTLIGCCLIHLCIGSVYALSVLYPSIIAKTGWSVSILVVGFSLSILSLGLTAAFHQKIFKGHYVVYVISYGIMLWFITNSALFSNIILENNYETVHYIFSLLLGFSIGLLYVVPINIVSGLNFSNKGLASGSVVGCFGLGSIISAKLFSSLISFENVSMLIFSFLCSIIMLLGLKMIKTDTEKISSPKEFKQDKKWYLIAVMFLFNIGIGISLLSNLTQFSLGKGLNLSQAVSLVALAGLANTLGRFIYSAISDKISKSLLLGLMFQVQLIALLLIKIEIFYEIGVIVVISVYGGMFAILPSFLNELYKNSTAYSQILSMWGIAGIIFPIMFNFGEIKFLVFCGSILCLIWSFCCIKYRGEM